MKNIKFRAINKWFSDSKMVYFDIYEGFSEIFEKSKPNADWEIMQFTGLLDKNGKEIWEGDIIKQIAELGTDLSGDIRYNEKAGAFLVRGCFNIQKDIEIIGNVWESPELLQKELSKVKNKK